MRRMTLGSLMGVGLLIALVALLGLRDDALAQRPAASAAVGPAVAGAELIVVPMTLSDKVQMVTVVDPRQRVMSVYHIEAATGKITLKSARNIQWDLQINDFNTDKPLPQEIRSSMEQR
ncbi:MAG: hypothetical protein ABFC63_11155 [Thermoguttaceae bacterium]